MVSLNTGNRGCGRDHFFVFCSIAPHGNAATCNGDDQMV